MKAFLSSNGGRCPQVALTQDVDTPWLLMSTRSHKPIVNWNITSWKRISFAFVFGTPQLNVVLSKSAQSLKFPCSWTKSAGFITYMVASCQVLGWRWTDTGWLCRLLSWIEWTPLSDTVSRGYHDTQGKRVPVIAPVWPSSQVWAIWQPALPFLWRKVYIISAQCLLLMCANI